MTIGKKLYMNFGIILVMVVVLFGVNWLAVQREHTAKAAAATSLELQDTTTTVRSQMMQNRLFLSNYLLSGDTREVDRMNDGLRTLNEKLEQGKGLANSDQVKNALTKVQQLEQAWGKEFSQPLIDKRKDVDSGNATVAELQIYYLQKDASSWVKNSTDALDVADGENRKLVDARQKSDASAATWTITVSALSTFCSPRPRHRRCLHHGALDYRATLQLDERGPRNRQHRRSGTQHRPNPRRRNRRTLQNICQDGRLFERDGRSFRGDRRRRSVGGSEAAFFA